jgi:SAM-dependent methyltransferase
MAEHRLFDGDRAYVSTAAFHADRARAPHLEQADHRARLVRAAEVVRALEPQSVVDLGCGDGGLLSLLRQPPAIPAWGYDFQPSNVTGWAERGVDAELRDVFDNLDVPRWGQVAVLTEVLEHLTDPHLSLAWVGQSVQFVVASSPWNEGPGAHPEEHAWAWDVSGYRQMFDDARYDVLHHEQVGWSQIIAARSLLGPPVWPPLGHRPGGYRS